jgi:hypothetical protein
MTYASYVSVYLFEVSHVIKLLLCLQLLKLKLLNTVRLQLNTVSPNIYISIFLHARKVLLSVNVDIKPEKIFRFHVPDSNTFLE